MKKLALFSTALVLFLSSCLRTEDEGTTKTELRNFNGTFDEVETNGSADVFITSDSSYQIKIECGENLIPYIVTNVSNGKLTVRINDNPIRIRKQIRIYIGATQIRSLAAYGSGNVRLERSYANDIYIHLKGSGNIEAGVYGTKCYAYVDGSGNIDLTGTLNENYLDVDGSGNIDARSISVNYSNANVSGSGNITLNASSKLDATITGSGNIFYRGNPVTVNSKITGSGNINKIN